MQRFGGFIKWFFYITSGILIVCAVNFEIAGMDTIPRQTLWQILLSGFLTALVTLLFYPGDCRKKSTVILRCLLHYVLLCAVMLICGHWFGWLQFNPAGIAMMAVSVAVVYLLSFLAYYLIDLRQADEINQRLKEKYSDKE